MLFTQNPEHAHHATLKALACISKNPAAGAFLGSFFSAPELPVEVFGLQFPNPLGLAAGMDKFAAAVPVWEKLGFGFCELGGVTWHSATGQPAPRIFRAPPRKPSSIAWALTIPARKRLRKNWPPGKTAVAGRAIPSASISANPKSLPLEKAAEDYANSFRVLRELCRFFCHQRQFAQYARPSAIAGQDRAGGNSCAIREVQMSRPRPRPALLVKVAPDLSFEALDEILELAAHPKPLRHRRDQHHPFTARQRNMPRLQKIYSETGGLSGKPLRERSTEIIRHIFKQTAGNCPSSASAAFSTPTTPGKNRRRRNARSNLQRTGF